MRCNIYNVKLHCTEFCICVFNQLQCKDRWVVLTVWISKSNVRNPPVWLPEHLPFPSRAHPLTIGDRQVKIRRRQVKIRRRQVSTEASFPRKRALVSIQSEWVKNFLGPLKIQGSFFIPSPASHVLSKLFSLM